jgi:hypothetical protein
MLELKKKENKRKPKPKQPFLFFCDLWILKRKWKESRNNIYGQKY